MKNLLTKLKYCSFLMALSLSIIFLYSCRTYEEKKPLTEFRLTEEQERWVPYKNIDTMIFKNSFGDTMIYIGSSKMETRYNHDWNGYPFGIVYYKSYSFFDKDSFFFLMIIDPGYNTNGSFNILWNKTGRAWNNYDYSSYFSVEDYLERDKKELLKDTLFFDSLKIENYIYYNVYKIFYSKEPFSTKINMKILFYNLQYGILKIEFGDNSSWILIPKK